MSDTSVFFRQMAIRKMAVDMAISEKTVELVISHAFKGARQAFHEHSSVEISGFGKFVMLSNNTRKQKEQYRWQLNKWKKEIEDNPEDKTIVRNRKLWIAEVEGLLELIKKLEKDV